MARAAIIAIVVAVILTVGSQEGGSTAFAQQAESNDVTVVSVEVSPSEPAPGERITVIASVTNSGTTTVEHTLEVTVDGANMGSKTIGLAPGETQVVSFLLNASSAGEMEIAVGGVSQVVRVVELAPVATVAPVATAAPVDTAAPAGTVEGVMRVGPSVRLSALRQEITSTEDAQIDLFWNNSELNELAVRIEVTVDVPSGLYIYSGNGAMACAAGRCLGTFTAIPGSVRNMPIYVKSDKVGSYLIHLNGRYWPEGNPDRWNPVSLSTPIEVSETSVEPGQPPTPVPEPTTPPPPTPESTVPPPPPDETPWYLTPLALVGWAILAIVVVVLAGYNAISRMNR